MKITVAYNKITNQFNFCITNNQRLELLGNMFKKYDIEDAYEKQVIVDSVMEEDCYVSDLMPHITFMSFEVDQMIKDMEVEMMKNHFFLNTKFNSELRHTIEVFKKHNKDLTEYEKELEAKRKIENLKPVQFKLFEIQGFKTNNTQE